MRSSRVGRRPARSQWKVGRLEDRIRDLALDLIVSGEDLARFEHDPRLHERRAKILIEFEAELRSPQRTPSRIKKPFRSMSPVGVGDVFWVALPEGRRALLRCVAISGDERDKSPTVEVLDWVPPDDPHDTGALRARPLCRIRTAHGSPTCCGSSATRATRTWLPTSPSSPRGRP